MTWHRLANGAAAAAVAVVVLAAASPPLHAAPPTGDAKRPSASPGLSTPHLGSLTRSDPRPARSVNDQLLVKLTPRAAVPGSAARGAIAKLALRHRALGGRWFVLGEVTTAPHVKHTLAGTPGVAAVQRDHVRQAFGDPYYRRYQPYLRASMDVNGAWGYSTGAGVTVAVLDTGVDVRHEDLGRTLRGRDFVDGDRVTQDPVGHGTFVAGVIAASRDNGEGVAGVSRASILPVRVLNAKGFGRDSRIAEAIRWAVRQDADVINLSLGGARQGRILRDAVDFADANGVLVVAAAGNDGGTGARYPAAFEPAVAVGATDLRDRMVWWSQHGQWLDLVAPGHRIVSTVPGDRYAMGSGTSFSAPLVSGAAALMWSQHPSWTADEVRTALLASAADAGPVGPDPFTGLGVPDVDGALGGPVRDAVPLTDALSGAMPATAQPLTRESSVPASSPEGTARWFALSVSDPTRVTVSARGSGRSPVLRGDIELTMYDAAMGRLDRSDSAARLGKEQVEAVVDDTVYVRVSNQQDTRWPARIELGLQQTTAAAGQVQVGGAVETVVIDSVPPSESYGADVSAPLTLTTGVEVEPSSVGVETLYLLDGETGTEVPLVLTQTATGWQAAPVSGLVPGRSYALVLDGARTPGDDPIPATRVGFRTGS